MTKMKFTPPTEFPAEYVTEGGQKAVILGRAPVGKYPLIGYTLHTEGGDNCSSAEGWTEDGQNNLDWTEDGRHHLDRTSSEDLYDIPKRISTWHNVYANWVGPQCSSRSDADNIDILGIYVTEDRLCVYRIERDPDGGNPEIFVEDV